MDRKEICRILNISRATYQRDIAVIKPAVKPQERPVSEKATEEIKSNAGERKTEIQAVQPPQDEPEKKQTNREENQRKTDKIYRNSLFSCCIKNSAPILKKALRRSAAGGISVWDTGCLSRVLPSVACFSLSLYWSMDGCRVSGFDAWVVFGFLEQWSRAGVPEWFLCFRLYVCYGYCNGESGWMVMSFMSFPSLVIFSERVCPFRLPKRQDTGRIFLRKISTFGGSPPFLTLSDFGF